MEIEFLKLNSIPRLNIGDFCLPNNYFSDEDWHRFYYLNCNSDSYIEDWMLHTFSYKDFSISYRWETRELVIRREQVAYLAIYEADTTEAIEMLAEAFINWLLWHEPCSGQLALPWGESTLMPRFRIVDSQMYTAAYKGLIECGVPVNTAKRGALVVAMDDSRLPNFGRTPQQMRDAHDVCTWLSAKRREKQNEES